VKIYRSEHIQESITAVSLRLDGGPFIPWTGLKHTSENMDSGAGDPDEDQGCGTSSATMAEWLVPLSIT